MTNTISSYKLNTSVLIMASFMVIALMILAVPAHAQMYNATMPILYNQNNVAVSTGAGSLLAGYYYLNGNQIYYYGNGTYYDPSVKMYGGSVGDPNGTAGVALNYVTTNNVGYVMATMPAFYNLSNVQVNGGVGYLNAGYYNPANGRQVYYYGNGTYYNSSILMYGGSVSNPNGSAGVSLGYSA